MPEDTLCEKDWKDTFGQIESPEPHTRFKNLFYCPWGGGKREGVRAVKWHDKFCV